MEAQREFSGFGMKISQMHGEPLQLFPNLLFFLFFFFFAKMNFTDATRGLDFCWNINHPTQTQTFSSSHELRLLGNFLQLKQATVFCSNRRLSIWTVFKLPKLATAEEPERGTFAQHQLLEHTWGGETWRWWMTECSSVALTRTCSLSTADSAQFFKKRATYQKHHEEGLRKRREEKKRLLK